MIDYDVTTRFEFIDSFAIDMAAETYVAGTSQLVNVTGTFQLASTVLRIGVECRPGFIGESCVPIDTCTTDSCSNNGICIQNDTGFTCVCMCDFTGNTCETRIDNCEGVDCNSGTCVDGVEMFTCQCDAGYSGLLCDQATPTTGMQATTTTNVGSESSERSSAELAVGTVFGIFILITATVITILIILLLRQRRNEGAVSQGNVAYGYSQWSLSTRDKLGTGPCLLYSGASLQGTSWGQVLVSYTVEPLYKGQVGDGSFVPWREVVGSASLSLQ